MAKSYVSDSDLHDRNALGVLHDIAAQVAHGELAPVEAAEALRRLRQAVALGATVVEATDELLLEGLDVQPKGDG